MSTKKNRKKSALRSRITSPNSFRYKPLNKVRTLAPLGYILVDQLIDLVGYNLFKDVYPKSKEDFSQVGNYEDSPFEISEGRWSESIWPDLKHTGGPGASYLTLHYEPRRSNKQAVKLDPKVRTFRTKVWKYIVRSIQSGKLTAYEVSADGRCNVIPKRERGLIRFQSEHILRTSSAWRVEGIGWGHRMLVCFRAGNVRSLIQKETATKGAVNLPALELGERQTISLLKELGLYCQVFAEPISEQAAKDTIRAIFGSDVKLPANKKMREVFSKVKDYLGPDAFCQPGEKFEFDNKNSTEQRQFINGYIQFRDLIASGKIARENVFKYAKKPTGSDVAERAADTLTLLLNQAGLHNEKSY